MRREPRKQIIRKTRNGETFVDAPLETGDTFLSYDGWYLVTNAVRPYAIGDTDGTLVEIRRATEAEVLPVAPPEATASMFDAWLSSIDN